MEQQLAEAQWSPLSAVDSSSSPSPSAAANKEREVIHRLEGQVDEQRKMRLNDAKLVEAKAAKIKEWVTNKLREVRAPPQRNPSCLVVANFLQYQRGEGGCAHRLAKFRQIALCSYFSRRLPSAIPPPSPPSKGVGG